MKKFHHFPHDKPAVDLNLDHVTDWFTTYPEQLEYEILGLVRGDTNSQSERHTAAVNPKAKKAGGAALAEVYEYFTKGLGMGRSSWLSCPYGRSGAETAN